MFTIFIGATLFFLLAVKFIHKKSLKGLITHNYRISWTKVFFGLVVWLALLSIFELILYFVSPETYYLKANWDKVFILLLICITVLPIQTTLEELFFRSYVMKGIGLIARSKWIPLIITSLLFGLVHSSNPEISKYGIVPMQLYYISAGLLLGIITIMDDGLELAIGVHAATNIYGALFVCYDGSVLQTDSIWHVTDINAWVMAVIFIVSGIIFLLLSKKIFDWAAWSKLTEKIKK
jgi:membrane protease YdiL (CAAX protease family)